MLIESYFDAWGLWWHGDLGRDYMLWGIPVFAWERIGKLLSFFGGLTVILDIVGAPAVRTFGKYLRDLITVRQAVVRMFYSVLYVVDHIVILNSFVYDAGDFATEIYLSNKSPARKTNVRKLSQWLEWDSREQKLFEIDRWSERMTDVFVLLISAGAIIVSFYLATKHWSGPEAIMFLIVFLVTYTLFAVFILGMLLTLFWPAATGVVLVAFSVVALILDAIIDRVADVLEHPKNDQLLRIFGVLLFLIGFHFDLLGS